MEDSQIIALLFERSEQAIRFLQDKYGNPYGWGVAQYTTPEHVFGYDYITSAYKTAPEESKRKIIAHLQTLLPNATESEIMKIIKI